MKEDHADLRFGKIDEAREGMTVTFHLSTVVGEEFFPSPLIGLEVDEVCSDCAALAVAKDQHSVKAAGEPEVTLEKIKALFPPKLGMGFRFLEEILNRWIPEAGLYQSPRFRRGIVQPNSQLPASSFQV